jgi:hypothetical protein
VYTIQHADAGAHQVFNATVNDVLFALPTRAQPPGFVVQFENLCFVAVHLGVTTSGKACHTSPNDDY